MREKIRPRKPSPQRSKWPSPEDQLDEFLVRGCCCTSKCYQLFDRAEYERRQDEANALSRDALDMVVLGQIMACTCMDGVVGPSHKHAPTQRQMTRVNCFYHLGKKDTFLALHGISIKKRGPT